MDTLVEPSPSDVHSKYVKVSDRSYGKHQELVGLLIFHNKRMSSKPKRLDECSVNQMTVDLISKGCQGISQYKARGTSLKKGYQHKWPFGNGDELFVIPTRVARS